MPENTIRQTEENAILLLAAAEELDLPANVVTTNNGALQAPDEVVKKAGLESGLPTKTEQDPDEVVEKDEPESGKSTKTAQKRAAKKSADADSEEN